MTNATLSAEGPNPVPQRTAVAVQFDDAAQQRDADTLGMWLFLATEVLFFGVLFLSYSVARAHFPDAFAAASRHTNLLLGGTNTAVLLTSSFTMALAVRAAGTQDARSARRLLLLTATLGAVFCAIKLTEYALDYRGHLVPLLDFAFDVDLRQGALVFFLLYFATTGLHLVHLTIGIAIVLVLAWRTGRGAGPRHAERVEVAGLYWHFVDLVWIFLYPCLYLVARA